MIFFTVEIWDMRECFLSVILIYGLGLLDHELLYYVPGTEVLAI